MFAWENVRTDSDVLDFKKGKATQVFKEAPMLTMGDEPVTHQAQQPAAVKRPRNFYHNAARLRQNMMEEYSNEQNL